MLFISHDLALVGRISDRVAVMFAGTIVEEGPPDEVLHRPAHPYTRALLDAIPRGLAGRNRPRKVHAEAQVLSEAGCPFAPRCPMAEDLCRTSEPPAVPVTPGHFARCHFANQIVARSDMSPAIGTV
jgi:oligopeptide/dipeptide ABC transporter ATP-binding protein